MTLTPVDDVPKPPGVAALPVDGRGYPIPAHVDHLPGQPVRLTELSPLRLILLNGNRRCTICGWVIGEYERCWYPTHPHVVQWHRERGGDWWEGVVEGAGHDECMVYAAIVCPFLAIPGYERRTHQRHAGEVVVEKGTPLGDIVLAGQRHLEVAFATDGTPTAFVAGDDPEVIEYNAGPDLLPELDDMLRQRARVPNAEDLAFAELITSDRVAELATLAAQKLVDVSVRQGARLRADRRNDRCDCDSGVKWKFCCGPRAERAKRLPPLAPYLRWLVDPRVRPD